MGNGSKKIKSSTYPFDWKGAYDALAPILSIGIQSAFGPTGTETAICEEKKKYTSGVGQGNIICHDGFTVILHKPIEKFIKSEATIHFTKFVKGIVEASQGDQYSNQPTALYTMGTFIDGQQAGTEDWPDQVFALNVMRRSTAGIGEGNNTVVSGPTSHMYLKNVKIDYQLQNLATNPLKFTVYWCLCKDDSADDPYTTWNRAISYQQFGQSGAKPSYSGSTTVTSGSSQWSTHGTKPTNYKLFNDCWKVLKVQSYTLEAGARCQHDITFRYNLLVSQQLMQKKWDSSNGARFKFVQGVTIVPLVVVNGYVQYVADANNPNNPDMTYSTGKYGYIIKEHYTLVPHDVEQNFPIHRTAPNYWANSSFASAVANEKVISYQDPVVEGPVRVT